MLELPLSIFGGLFIGSLTGLLGNASLLAIPFLILLFDASLSQAIIGSLLISFSTSLLSFVSHARTQEICWRTAGYFGLSASCIAFFTAKAVPYFPASLEWSALSLVTLANSVAIGYFVYSERNKTSPPQVDAESTRAPLIEPQIGGVIGMGIGTITGLSGVSCGFFMEPILHRFGKLSTPMTLGTSAAVMTATALSTMMGYESSNFLSSHILIPLAGISGATSYVITRFSSPFSLNALRVFYAFLLFVISLWFGTKAVF